MGTVRTGSASPRDNRRLVPRLHTNLCRAAVTSLSLLHHLVATHGNFIRCIQSWSVQQTLPFPVGEKTLELFYAAVAEDFHPS